MKKNRIIGNVLEFLLLCISIFLLLLGLSKITANHDHGVLGILLIAYGTTALINFVLQTALLHNSDKTGRQYFFAKAKLFAVILTMSMIIGTLYYIEDSGIEVIFLFLPFLLSCLYHISLFFLCFLVLKNILNGLQMKHLYLMRTIFYCKLKTSGNI